MTTRTRSPEDLADAARKGQVPTVPVDLEETAKELGVSIIRHRLPIAQSGMLAVKNGKAVIVVNSRHHPRRQRFSIAHELGHYMDWEEGGRDRSVEVFHRQEGVGVGTRQEARANRFAAELLMPKEVVVHEFESGKERDVFQVSDAEVQRLARHFNVSVAAMTFRLINLGLLSQGESED